MSAKIKILFILPSLKAGGAERVITFLAQHLNEQSFECVLLIIGSKNEAVYNVENVETIFLNKTRVYKGIPSIFTIIKKVKPHIVFGSIAHVNKVIALYSILFPKIIFVGREASIGSIMKQYSTAKPLSLYKFFFKRYHKYLDAIICQSKDMAQDLINNYDCKSENLFIINNPITSDSPVKENTVSNKTKKLITIGRLSKEKGHERILHILGKVKFDFEYCIIGNGPEKESIKNLSTELGILNKIKFIEHTDNVYAYLTTNDVFLQGSYVEGFPNAVLESCVVGTPVIAFDAPGGTKEIIENGINGYIVNNEIEFEEKLKYLLFEKNLKSKAISESVKMKFSKEKIVSEYETLLLKLAKK